MREMYHIIEQSRVAFSKQANLHLVDYYRTLDYILNDERVKESQLSTDLWHIKRVLEQELVHRYKCLSFSLREEASERALNLESKFEKSAIDAYLKLFDDGKISI